MLKIDRGLIAHIVGGERDRIVVKAMIRLARELGLSVVVEGVESTGQLALLAEWGCDYLQGALTGLAAIERPWGDAAPVDRTARGRTRIGQFGQDCSSP